MTGYPRPPLADENASLVDQRLKEARESSGVRETVTVDWNGQPLHVDVIDMPVANLYFNPKTHRIRAQRSHDPAKDRRLDDDPWADQSQEYLKCLLQALPADPARRDPDFDALKESLEQYGQNDPGLITREGILVNGNTRTAALKELGRQSVRVGVLPASSTWVEISAVELSLQLRKDHRRDYSYINKLLAIEEQASLGRSADDIAKEFRIRAATYEQERWILATIREMIERSRGVGSVLRLVDFEEDQEKLKELHRAYVKLEAASKDQAELLKESRMVAIVLGFSKTDVRLIDQNFQEKYLDRASGGVVKSVKVSAFKISPEAAPALIPGLGLAPAAPAPKVSEARAFTDQVLKAKATAASSETLSVDTVKGAATTVEIIKKATDSALDSAGRDARLRKRKQAVSERLRDASANVDQCVMDLAQARASQSLDEDAFDDAVLKLRESLTKLARQASRISHPGDGVAWLVEATAKGNA